MKKIIKYILFVIIIVGYYFLNKYYNIGIPCIFSKITGLYCPGCGVTRMLFSIINLNFYQAFRYNPFVFILLICYIIYIIINIISKKKIKLNNNVYYVLIILLIIYGILRNIEAFNYLVPTKI